MTASDGGAGSDPWLERVFHAGSRDELVRHYDDWAETYDSDIQGTGYVHPAVLAGLVCRHMPERNAPILDAGVGTGMLGGILAILGYRNLIGIDISEGMLERARRRKVYRDLRNRVLGESLDFADGSVAAAVSTGTFTTGHAPASAWDELVRVTRRGGYFISTFGTTVWEENGFAAKFADLAARRLVEEVEVTPLYYPLPLSSTAAHFTARAHVYRKL